VLLYWAYWAEHTITWGDPRFGVAVYPVLVGIAIAGKSAKRDGAVSAAKTSVPA
jgi:hypothetical protein